jgi:hypothetical protein
MTVFYCLRFETPPTWKAKSPYLYPPGTGWPSYTSRPWVPFSSPFTTRRATVGVFEPASKLVTLVIKPWVAPNRKHRFLKIPLLLQKCCMEIIILLLLRSCKIPVEPVYCRCLAINYSVFQASSHSIIHVVIKVENIIALR